MIGLLFAASLASQPSPAATPKRAIKTCPDGSVIYASQECLVLPDHRYLMNYQPKVEMKTIEWWCGKDRQPSQARIAVRQRRDAGAGTKSHDLTIVALVNRGRRAAPAVRARLEAELSSLDTIGDLYGRCLNRRNGNARAILIVRGYQRGVREPRLIEIEMP